MAVRTALAVRHKTASLNRERAGKWPTVTINIGIHSGEALVGVNKIQSGSETRWIYTCTGYAANLASRIGASATNGAILVSEATAERVEADFELRQAGPQSFKGISHPIEIYSVVGAR
jgi:class 3 adenylate cyclase